MLRQTIDADPDQRPKVLAIIPARGGSKGLPRKNIIDLCGKPLIAYSIETALKSKLINRVIVSTEDEETAEISKSFGAEVPFLRPKELAGDRSNIVAAIDFTVNKLQSNEYKPDAIVILYPTHPFRTLALVDHLAGKLIEGHNPVKTFKAVSHKELSLFTKKTGQNLNAFLHRGHQDEKKPPWTYYRPYGLFIGLSGSNLPYLHRIKNPISLIDIDAIEDLFLAEEVIRNRLFNFDSEDIIDSHHPYIHPKG
jgi:CMP-N-acetylneuraminic acid synthetase